MVPIDVVSTSSLCLLMLIPYFPTDFVSPAIGHSEHACALFSSSLRVNVTTEEMSTVHCISSSLMPSFFITKLHIDVFELGMTALSHFIGELLQLIDTELHCVVD